jgi:hypothetical protein
MRTQMNRSTMDRAMFVTGIVAAVMWAILMVAGVALMVLVASS